MRLHNFSKYLKFGKFLTALGGIGAVLSIVLAFIPVPNPVLGIVKKLDSKVIKNDFAFFNLI